MTIKPFYKVLAALLMSVMMVGAQANSVTFDSNLYDGTGGQITVTVNYDFTDFQMFGGGLDLMYNTDALSFVSYTQSPLPADAQPGPSSPIGNLDAAGMYINFGIGTFDFFGGMGGAGPIGVFVFDVIGAAAPGTSGTPCGAALCLTGNDVNPMVSLAGVDLNTDFFPQGAEVLVPVPAAVWFMLSGIGALLGMRRRS